MDYDKIIEELDIYEKINLLSGHNFMYTNENTRLGIKSLRMSDGPSGVRLIEDSNNGITSKYKTISYPSGFGLSSTFNKELLYKVGEQIGKEANSNNIDIMLSPSINMVRSLYNGRNLEFMGEDKILSSSLASSYINGMQQHVNATLKHFCLNNNDGARFYSDSIISKRGLMEGYLYSFYRTIKDSNPHAIMTSYNKYLGTYVSENDFLIKDILRNKFKYDGLVMTDWGGTFDRNKSLKSGVDLEMPGDSDYGKYLIYDNYKRGNISIDEINSSLKRILNVKRYDKVDFNINEALDISLQASIESHVLLKHNKSNFPLNKNKKYLVLGKSFKMPRFQGMGSMNVNPYNFSTIEDEFNKLRINYSYDNIENLDGINDLILFLETDAKDEGESTNKKTIKLDSYSYELINKIKDLKINKHLVLISGSGIIIDFDDYFDNIILSPLAGGDFSKAITGLLFGLYNPSGRLSISFPKEELIEFNMHDYELYKEDIFIGYKYYYSKNINLKYPFGYGLSYSDFLYKGMKLDIDKDNLIINLVIKNIGEYDDYVVPQIFVKYKNSNIYRPKIELIGFDKVFLKKNEKKKIEIKIPLLNLGYYDVNTNNYEIEDLDYNILVGNNIYDILLDKEIHIKGTKPILSNNKLDIIYKNYDFDKITDELFLESIGYKLDINDSKKIYFDTPIYKYKNRFMGKLVYKIFENIYNDSYKKALKEENPFIKINKINNTIFLKNTILSSTMMSIMYSSSGRLKYNVAEGLLYIANNRLFKGLFKMMKSYKIKGAVKKLK